MTKSDLTSVRTTSLRLPLDGLSLWLTAWIFLALFPLNSGLCSAEKARPNIVLIYLDDWGWNGTPVAMDPAMPNSRMPILEMPHLEKLASEGMTFTRAYGSPQCAPARAALQTGQSAPRTGFTLVLGTTKHDYYDLRPQYSKMPLIPNVSDQHLDEDALTIAKAIKPLGYSSAHFGKWHLYTDPSDAGFEVHDGDTTNVEGQTIGNSASIPKDLTDPKLMFSMSEKAINFMRSKVAGDQPFFVQVSHYAMHAHHECLPATREKYAAHPAVQDYYKRTRTTAEKIRRYNDPATWLGMGEDLDTAMGMILEAITEMGIEENTYVVVVSDNGYRHDELLVTPDMKQPLHGHKWWLWEAGIRVPMFVKGPGIPANSRFDANVINYDLFPTFYEWAGEDPEELKDIDGISLAKFARGARPDEEFINRPLYFHLPHYREEVPHSAIISNRQKVIHFYERPELPMLFDLEDDSGETTNIAKQRPEMHKRLHEQLIGYLEKVDARFPKPNPDFDSAAYLKHKNYEKYQALGPFEDTRNLSEDER